MTVRSLSHSLRATSFAGGVVLVAAMVALGIDARSGSVAHAVCAAEGTEDPSGLFSVSPAPIALTLQGTAPFQVTITFQDTTLLSTPLTMSFTWGDGASSPVTIVSCGDDRYNVPVQQLSHTFNSPGQFPVQWHLNAQGIQPIDSLAVIVTVTAAAPTPAPPSPTVAAPTPPAATPVPTAAAPGVTTAPTIAESVTAEPSATVSARATATLVATTTTSARPTSVPSATSEPTVAAAIVTASPTTPTPPPAGRPELIRSLPDVTDVSTDADVLATNLVFAGITIWVFFSSVLFNQTMQEHRSEVSAWFRWARRPGKLARVTLPAGRAAAIGVPAGVLAGMGLIYGLLEPGFGFNQRSVVLFLSVTIGVGVVGFFYSGLEAWARRRTLGSVAAVRAFPLALLVALASVALSKLLDLHPGVVYGFAASCVVLGGAPTDGNREGRALALPVAACLALSVLCWLLVAPARAFPINGVAHVLEGIAVIVFIGGLEGLLVNLMPLDVMDGSKIYRWNRWAWAALLLVSAFLFWHVLLNSQRQYFDSLRAASSATVLVAFVAYTAAGAGLWAWFKWRGGTALSPAQQEEGTAGGS